MADTTTRMKILLSPAWDHNFFMGPARWTAGQPHDHADLGGQDNYHPGGANGLPETFEPWFPLESNPNDPAGRVCWDADRRIIPKHTFAFGGAVTNKFTGNVEETETKNRLRGTANPHESWDENDVTFINKVTSEPQDSSSNAFRCVNSHSNHFQDYVHDAILQNSDPSDTTSALYKIYPNKPGTTPIGNFPTGYGTWQSTIGSQFSKHWVEGSGGAHGGAARSGHFYHIPPLLPYGEGKDGEGAPDPETYTYAYEYSLNVESLTHTWNTLSSPTMLPGLGASGALFIDQGNRQSFWPDFSQIVALGIDIGAMREIITISGTLYDGPKYTIRDGAFHLNDPYAAPNETPIRKQQLMDIVRTQWGPLSPQIENEGAVDLQNPNRFPALTIGPMHTSNPNGDQGKTFDISPARTVPKTAPISPTIEGSSHFTADRQYTNPKEEQTKIKIKALDMWRYGEEPSDDIRGSNLRCIDGSAKHIEQVWDYKFNYQGRRRYRGLLSRVSLTLQGGSPDVWNFSFDFLVFKNETTYRKPDPVDVNRMID